MLNKNQNVDNNKILLYVEDRKHPAIDIILYGFYRSFSTSQVSLVTGDNLPKDCGGLVVIDPSDEVIPVLKKVIPYGVKILLLGKLGEQVAQFIGVNVHDFSNEIREMEIINDHMRYSSTQYAIKYLKDNITSEYTALTYRYLCRYDFEREWNNHGYGRITIDGSIWSLCHSADAFDSTPIAVIQHENGEIMGAYATITDKRNASILWFNRPVGPIDSLEWTVVEKYFSQYRKDDLACFPVLMEIPFGYEAAVTMHIDCDEALASGDELLDLYISHHVPFSIAVKTGQKITSDDIRFMRKVIEHGGSVVSHSVSHYDNWGEGLKSAYKEALESRRWLENHITKGVPVKHAVSPFYKNPPYAVEALGMAGYTGFISGIISSDPEYLMGRAGVVPFVDSTIVGHSQQCMLHGDCYHRYGNSIDPYIESFENHVKGKAIFGYLDHPFSERYWYGWLNEEERLNVHECFLTHIKKIGDVWFCSLDECLEFLEYRNDISIWIDTQGKLCVDEPSSLGKMEYSVMWKGEIFKI